MGLGGWVCLVRGLGGVWRVLMRQSRFCGGDYGMVLDGSGVHAGSIAAASIKAPDPGEMSSSERNRGHGAESTD